MTIELLDKIEHGMIKVFSELETYRNEIQHLNYENSALRTEREDLLAEREILKTERDNLHAEKEHYSNKLQDIVSLMDSVQVEEESAGMQEPQAVAANGTSATAMGIIATTKPTLVQG